MEKEHTVNFQILREQARSKILDLLDQISGRKEILLDPSLVGPLSLIVEMSSLKDHGAFNVAALHEERLEQVNSDILYIVRPTIEMMQIISEQLSGYKQVYTSSPYKFHLILCPRETTVCEKILFNNGVLGDFETVESLALYLMPLEVDLLSMQMDMAFRDLVLERDFTMYHNIARAILELEHQFGPIAHKQGKGQASAHIVNILKMLENENPDYISEHLISEISGVVLIDREIDLVTPLCTPLTYEALLDEIFGLSNNVIKVNPRILDRDDTDRPITISLTNTDSIFCEIRDLNFSVLKPLLTHKLSEIDRTYKEKDEQKSIEQLNSYVKRFKQANKAAMSVQNHLNLAVHITKVTIKNPFFKQNLNCEHNIIMNESSRTIFEHIEQMIGMGEDFTSVLRLLCLYSVTQNGLKSKSFDFFRKELVQSYGFEKIISLTNLERAGLLKRQETKSN